MNNQSIQTIIDLFVQGNQHIWLTDTRGGSRRGQSASEEALCQRRPHCRHMRYTMLRASHHLLICDGWFYPTVFAWMHRGTHRKSHPGCVWWKPEGGETRQAEQSSAFIKPRQKQRRVIWQHDKKLEKTVGTYTGADMGTGNMWSCGCRESGVFCGSVTGISIMWPWLTFSFTCSLIPFILNSLFFLSLVGLSIKTE